MLSFDKFDLLGANFFEPFPFFEGFDATGIDTFF